MNLATEVQEIHDSLFNGDVDIAIFVLNGSHYYIIDSKENYCIDVRPEYDAYIQNGWLKPEQLDEALNSFRGGIPLLDKSNFFEYMKIANVKCFTKSWMHNFFIHNKTKEDLCSFYSYIENFLSTSNEAVRPDWDEWRLRLPKFYINFDKKIFQHTDWERDHENLAPPNWSSQKNNMFGLLVPDSEQYWIIDGMNFWKLKM
ncbi:MAG: hypothetical protein FT726_24750 [Pantoea sp. Morm]|uniref:hypothetical protein n=1 Tax=Pantoea sp. Morm TaxID=2601250 RepID=UPI001D96ABD8|nr:hypothetical protein [Pantoea sp. Morm]